MIRWELSPFHRFAPVALFAAFLAALVLSVRSRAALQLEVVALRHQLGVLQRSVKRPTLTSADRLFWAWLCSVWSDWRSALVIVRPDTVITWHRTGFRLFWKWKTLCGRPGRPPVSTDVRELIRRMNRENPLWGAPRIHGELLKLGINVGETSVGKYMRRRRQPPSQTWRPFLKNHVDHGGVSPFLKGWPTSLTQAECHKGETCDRRDVLLSLDFVRDGATDDLGSQIRFPEQRSLARVQHVKISLAPSRKEKI